MTPSPKKQKNNASEPVHPSSLGPAGTVQQQSKDIARGKYPTRPRRIPTGVISSPVPRLPLRPSGLSSSRANLTSESSHLLEPLDKDSSDFGILGGAGRSSFSLPRKMRSVPSSKSFIPSARPKRPFDEAFPRPESPELGHEPLLRATQSGKEDDVGNEMAKLVNRIISNLEKEVENEKKAKELATSQVEQLTKQLEAEKKANARLTERINAFQQRAVEDYNSIDRAEKALSKTEKMIIECRGELTDVLVYPSHESI
ncbi:hypothetical protein PG989_015630 [Apiospora arundinis]